MKPQLSSGNRAFGHVLGTTPPPCPCSVLPEGMVVIEKWKLEAASYLLIENNCLASAKTLRDVLEKRQ